MSVSRLESHRAIANPERRRRSQKALIGITGAGGRQLFAATTKGTVRAYRLPLSQDFQELHCSASPMNQLTLSHDFCHLFASNLEGLVYVFAVKDRDPSRVEPTEKREDLMPWSEDVLLSKTSLEEKQQRITGLESQVGIVLRLTSTARGVALPTPRSLDSLLACSTQGVMSAH